MSTLCIEEFISLSRDESPIYKADRKLKWRPYIYDGVEKKKMSKFHY